MDIPIPRGVQETGDVSVQLGTHAINDCIQSLKLHKEKVAKLEEMTSSLRLGFLVAQLREGKKLSMTRNTFSLKQLFLNVERRRLDI